MKGWAHGGFVGEEGDHAQGTSGLSWVVDPLDGTVNFLFGIPQWCVSVAVRDRRSTLAGAVFAPKSSADAIDAGIVYVPEDRGGQGAAISLPIFQNISLPSLDRTSKFGVLRRAEEFALARAYAQRLQLRAVSLDQVRSLSGGNQQKVVIAKWLATRPKVIILDEPTKGIDIGSKAAVHSFMAELVEEGLSVIMVSSELPEILGMSDRVVVMRQGRMTAVHDIEGLTAETLVRAAAGLPT